MNDFQRPFRFFDAVTGVLQPGEMLLPNAAALAANTPAGHKATQLDIDPLTQRIDTATGQPVPYERPAPVQLLDPPTARGRRDELLAACDWVVARAYEQGAPVPPAWATYRQALRDWPGQPGWPDVPLPSPPAS